MDISSRRHAFPNGGQCDENSQMETIGFHLDPIKGANGMTDRPEQRRDRVEVLRELADFLEQDGDRNVVPYWFLREVADEITSLRSALAESNN